MNGNTISVVVDEEAKTILESMKQHGMNRSWTIRQLLKLLRAHNYNLPSMGEVKKEMTEEEFMRNETEGLGEDGEL